MKQILWAVFLIAAISGCVGSRQNKAGYNTGGMVETIDGHNARNSLDYQGTYVGTVLLDDSTLVDIAVTLNATDFIFRLTPVGEHTETIEKRGAYSWDKTGFIITLQGVDDALSSYFVGENHLRLLDVDGRQTERLNADNYILYRTEGMLH